MARRSARDERGAAFVITAIVALTLVAVAALAVDIGVQRVARTDMQSLADVVALDLARDLDCRTIAQLGDVDARTRASAARNGSTVGDPPVVQHELGTVDDDGRFVALTLPGDVPGAVRVTASTEVDFSFGLAEGGGAVRDAVARGNDDCGPPTSTPPCTVAPCPTTPPPPPTTPPCTGPTCPPSPTPTARTQPRGCLRIGSFVLDTQPGSTLSAAVARTLRDESFKVGAGLISYDGLAGAQVSLRSVAAELGAASPEALLASSVTLGEFATAVARAASRDNDPDNDGVPQVLNLSVLSSIAAANTGASAGRVAVGRLLAVTPGNDAALDSEVDVLGLVTGAALVANGSAGLAVPQLTVGGVSARIFITEPPQQACGSEVASTSQVRLRLTQDTPLVKVELNVELARARGAIQSIVCGGDVPGTMRVRLDQVAVADVSARVTLLSGLATAEVPANDPTPGAAGTQDLPLPASFTTPVRVAGNGTINAPRATSANLSLLGLGTISAGLTLPLVNTALDNLTSVLTTTAAPLLQLRLGGADLFAVDAECSVPVLVG